MVMAALCASNAAERGTTASGIAAAAEQTAAGGACAVMPAESAATIGRLQDEFGGFEHASLQVNFNTMAYPAALASMRLFAREVMPRFRDTSSSSFRVPSSAREPGI